METHVDRIKFELIMDEVLLSSKFINFGPFQFETHEFWLTTIGICNFRSNSDWKS